MLLQNIIIMKHNANALLEPNEQKNEKQTYITFYNICTLCQR